MASTAALRPARTKRVSLTRVLVLLASVGAVGYFSVMSAVVAAVPPATPGPSIFSSYVDVTAWPSYPFEGPQEPSQMDVTLSFIVAAHTDPCAPSWGGYYSMDEAATELELDRRVSRLRDVGGEARISFGGAANSELATVCTDESRLLEAYSSVVDRYDAFTIDLDIEGAALGDVAGNTRRATAIAALQEQSSQDGDDLTVWLTVPVGPQGLTAEGEALVAQMLAADVDLAGVNGMAMVFGLVTTDAEPQSDTIVESAAALQGQISRIYEATGVELSEKDAWTKVGLTVMIGQNDVETERFTIADAEVVNQFARDNGVGLLAMWSLNRDSTCSAPLPTVMTTVQVDCSGIDQEGVSFAETLALDIADAVNPNDDADRATPTPTPLAIQPSPVGPVQVVDDPKSSPYPIWEPLGTYPAGTKIVWRKTVYEAKFWTQGFTPDTTTGDPNDSPWTLLGPVLPGDKPAPLPTLPAGSYPDWDPEEIYTAGGRVLNDGVPYEAKWWTRDQEPGVAVEGGSPWLLIMPAG